MPPGPGPSWRGSAETPSRGNARSWRRPGSGSISSLPLRSWWVRSFLSLMSALIALASIVLFIVLVFVPGCAQTRFAVLSPAPYNDKGMPPIPFAQHDREDFRARFVAESLPELLGKSQSLVSSPKTSSKVADSARRVLVLYVTAMSGRNETGVVLFTEDSGPDEPEGYLPLDRLWEFLAKLPREQKKILAIDLSRGPIDWRWGQFTNPEPESATDQQQSSSEFGTALSKIPNLAILSSSSPGEISWSSATLGQSVFVHFLIRGIAGEADGSGGQPRDRRVTLAEINNFVLRHTNHWVSQNRDLRGQHPQLLTAPESRDGLLGTVVSEVRGNVSYPKPAATKANDDGARLRQLEALWEARDRWSGREVEQWHPLAWRQFLEHMRRAEQWWLAGQKEEMEPHLQAADAVQKEIAIRENSRNPEIGAYPFVAANISRRTSAGPLPETEPVLPERQLQSTLQGFAPKGLSKPLQDASLRLRTKAEQRSWQSFRSRLWTNSVLNDADRERRMSEDLLFVGNESDLNQSTVLRQSAEAKLEQSEQIFNELSEAHRLHSRLLSELPDLAWWAAQRLPVENLSSTAIQSRRAHLMKEYSLGIDEARFRPPSMSEQEKLRDEHDDYSLQQSEIDLLLLFENTRHLARLVDREVEPDPAFATRQDWREELKELKQALTHPERGLDALRGRLTRHATGLIGAAGAENSPSAAELGQTQYFHWLRLRNALQWLGLPAETRRGLFADLEQSDHILHVNAQKVPIATTADWNGDDWTGVNGCWQALWAMQSLSLGASDAAMHQRWVLWKNAVVDPKKQLGLLTQLGQEVRREYRARVDRAQPAPAASDRLEDALRSLLVAQRATRSLHGYDAVLFSLERDPVRRLQEFDLGALCLVQADRYLDDFWAAINSTDREPWYVQAATQCLRLAARQYDSLSISTLKTTSEEIGRRMQARQSARLKLVPRETRIDLSLSNEHPLRVTTEINDQVPPGVAALWMMEEGDASATKLDFLPPGRRSITSNSLTADLTVRKQRIQASGKCDELTVHPRLFFRARFWDSETDVIKVNPCPPNSIDDEYQPPSNTGEIVVHGVDRRDTIFILDCSLSMAPPMDPKNKQGESRFQAARNALSEALRVLRDGPVLRNEKEPHVVGLMAYGHRAKAKGGDPRQTATNPDWKAPIPSAVSEDWRNDFEILNPPDRLTDEYYRKIVGNLDLLQPFGQTPLLGSILSSARSLIDRKRGGVIVAITDGAYNDGAVDGTRYKSLQELLRGHPELSLHIVAFGLDEQSEIASLKKLGEHAHGTFHDAPNGTRLAEAIEKVMKPRQYEVIRDAQPRQEFVADLGQVVGGLSPHSYKVQFPDLQEFAATIDGGDRLEFDLDFANSGLKHRRPQPLLFRRLQDTTSLSKREPTRFGYLKADFDRTSGRADFQFCLDRDDLLSMIERPAEIRIDVSPRGNHLHLSRSWKLLPAQSVPAWQVELRNWPADLKPVVQASWKMFRTEPDSQWPLAPLLKEAQVVALPGWSDKSLQMTAERQAGKVLVRLQAEANVNEVNVADIRVELGQQSQVESKFLPGSFSWRSRLFETQRQMTFEFDIGEDFDVAQARIGLTSRSSLDRGSRTLESPLMIDKWDKEQ